MGSADVEGMTEHDYADILMTALDRIKKGVQGSLEEVIEQIRREIQREEKEKEEHVPYTTFIENVLSLPFHLRKVYFYLVETEESTAEEIAKNCEVNLQEANRALSQLVQNGFVRSSTESETGERFYFVPRVKKVPKFKQDFTWKCFLGPAMPPIYQYNLLCDAPRVEKLKNAITKTVKEGDIVADLGTGTGILAMFAAEKAKKVYAVEIDPFMIEAAKNITLYYPAVDKIEFIEADAETVELDEKVDVVICEMLDTALIREPQIPVMNHAIQNLLKPSGKVVPIKAITKIELVNSDYNFYGYDFSMPYYEKCGARHVKDILSNQELLHTIRFDEINPTVVDREITIKIVKNGFVNSFRLTTYVYADEDTFMEPTIWLNPPLVLPLTHKGNSQDIYVKKGDDISMYLFYEMGSSLDRISYSLI
jgi:predicted RNA methylase/predicted transcriptional regulator